MPIVPHLEIFKYSVYNKGGESLDVFIDGDIVSADTQEILKNFWGDETSTSYKSFRNQIEEISPKTLNVYINSLGGHVGDALAIHDYLMDKESKGITVNRIGRGLICSAGTFIMMGNNSTMSQNSSMMIHNISMVVVGDINQCENQVRAGRKFNDHTRDFYSSFTGKAPETIAKWMNNETWFNAEEAYSYGFIKNKPTGAVSFKNSISEDRFPYSNTSILNLYNSYTMPENNKSLAELITEGFNKLQNSFNSIFTSGKKPTEEETNVAFAEFTNTIVNAVNGSGISEDRIREVVQEMTKDFANVDSLSNFATIDSLKGLATADAVKNQINDSKNELIAAISQKSGSQSNEFESEKEKEIKVPLKKNKYSNYTEATKIYKN